MRKNIKEVDLEIVKVVVGSEEDELISFRADVGIMGSIRLKDSVDPEPVLLHLKVEGDNLCGKEDTIW